MQETGETRDAIIADDNKLIEEIINANKSNKEPYWIVVFAKPARNCVDGKYTLAKHIKPYNVKPQSQVGMLIGEVNNRSGNIKWEINMPQKPFDFDRLPGITSIAGGEVVIETSTISNAYLTK